MGVIFCFLVAKTAFRSKWIMAPMLDGMEGRGAVRGAETGDRRRGIEPVITVAVEVDKHEEFDLQQFVIELRLFANIYLHMHLSSTLTELQCCMRSNINASKHQKAQNHPYAR